MKNGVKSDLFKHISHKKQTTVLSCCASDGLNISFPFTNSILKSILN